MSSNEKWILGLAGAGLVGYLFWSHRHASVVVPYRPPVTASGGSGIGNAVAAVGGAAVAQLGKEAAGWASSELSSLFS